MNSVLQMIWKQPSLFGENLLLGSDSGLRGFITVKCI